MSDTIDVIFAKPLGCYIEIEYNPELSSIRFVRTEEKLKEKKTRDPTFELERYFQGERTDLSCELDISQISPFTQKVLEETRKIGYGKTITYSELARNIGCLGARAAGGALGKNPIPIVIPCHRVVAKNGIGGYSAGLDIKVRLLKLEKTRANNL